MSLAGTPLGAILVTMTLKDGPLRTSQWVWMFYGFFTGIFACLWCRRHTERETVSLSMYRLVVGMHALTVMTVVPSFAASISQARSALLIVSVLVMTVTLTTVTANDAPFSYVILASSIVSGSFSIPAFANVSLPFRIFDVLLLFGLLAPLIETVRRPQRATIELKLANDSLVSELRVSNAALSVRLATDPLTGLANRVGFDEAMSVPRPIGLLYIDVDHFKSVNDQHGHAVGDEVLIRVASALSRAAREGDVVARLGGDEFVMLLDKASTAAVRMIATRVQESVNREFATKGIRVSVSVGGTSADLREEEAATVLARADANLYEAKERGRNRVFIGV
jgi:diguanylate cyclase (GGDEF)-like protein